LKIQRIFLLLVSLLWLQACTVSGPVHFYSGQPRPISETARLRVPGPITVKKIDGKEVDVPLQDEGFYEIFLLPGLHRVDFKYDLYWGDATSGMLVDSDVVGVETRFYAGMNYDLTYPVPEDEEEAYKMANKFKATLLEKETSRQVASRTTAELNEFRINTANVYSSGVATQPKDNGAPTAESTGVMALKDIKADNAVRQDTVKRLKFWWLMANEEERNRFKEWMKSVEGVVSE